MFIDNIAELEEKKEKRQSEGFEEPGERKVCFCYNFSITSAYFLAGFIGL